MKHLVKICFYLAIVLLLTIGSLVLTGHNGPHSQQVKYWHFTDCLFPCWVNITPTRTSLDEAKKQITKAFEDFQLDAPSDITFAHWSKGIDDQAVGASIALRSDQGFISSITVGTRYESAQMPVLGDIFTLLGPPTCVSVSDYLYTPSLIYEKLPNQATITINLADLSLFRPIKNIAIDQTKNAYRTCERLNAVAWQGFQSPKQYFIQQYPLVVVQ